MELDTFRAVNPRHLQIFRVDREGIIDDIIMHELINGQKTLVDSDCLEYLCRTLEKDVVGIVTFDQSYYCLY